MKIKIPYSIQDSLQLIGGIIVWIIIALFLLTSFKSCTIKVWIPPEKIEVYQGAVSEDWWMTVAFYPDQYVMVMYDNFELEYAEAILTKMWGVRGEKVLGKLWYNRNWESTLLGYKFFKSGLTPVSMDIDVLNKYINGIGESPFPKIGTTKEALLVFGDSSLVFNDTWCMKLDQNEIDIKSYSSLLDRLKKTKN